MAYKKLDHKRIAEMRKRWGRTLLDVEEFKDRYYAGTQEIYGALKRISVAYENPEKASALINHSLEQQCDSITYRATPERVFGAINTISDSFNLGQENLPETSFIVNNLGKVLKYLELDEFNLKGMLAKPSSLKKALFPYFLAANNIHIDSDPHFGLVVFGRLADSLLHFEKDLDSRFSRHYTQFGGQFLKRVRDADWSYALSRKHLHAETKEIVDRSVRHALSIEDIVHRLIHDKVDHLRQYKIQVLSQWLLEKDIKSYGEAVAFCETRRAKERVQYEENVTSNILFMIEQSRKKIVMCDYIQQLLVDEKDFVTDYLQR